MPFRLSADRMTAFIEDQEGRIVAGLSLHLYLGLGSGQGQGGSGGPTPVYYDVSGADDRYLTVGGDLYKLAE